MQARGLQPVTRNYRCRGGEIDLIMRQGETLVFVEVRYRANATHGVSIHRNSIDTGKMRRSSLDPTFLLA